MLHKCQLAGFASIGWNEPDLGFTFPLLFLFFLILTGWLSLALGYKRQPPAIRRPAWVGSIRRARRKALRFTTLGGDHPDGRAIFMFPLVYSGHHKRDALPIRRNARRTYRFVLVQILDSDLA